MSKNLNEIKYIAKRERLKCCLELFKMTHSQILNLLVKTLARAKDINRYLADPKPLIFPDNPKEFLAQIHIVYAQLHNQNPNNIDDYRVAWNSIAFVNSLVDNNFENCPGAYLGFIPDKYLDVSVGPMDHPYVGFGQWALEQEAQSPIIPTGKAHYKFASKAGASTAEATLIEKVITHILSSGLDLEQWIFYGIGYPNLFHYYKCLVQSDDWIESYLNYIPKTQKQLLEKSTRLTRARSLDTSC